MHKVTKPRKPAGRPYQHTQNLELLLGVEIWCAVTGQSVNRYFNTNILKAADGTKIPKATAKRRYYDRMATMKPCHWPWGAEAPNPLLDAWQSFAADVRSVFTSE